MIRDSGADRLAGREDVARGFRLQDSDPWVGILNRFIDRNRNHVIDREFPELESGERESGK